MKKIATLLAFIASTHVLSAATYLSDDYSTFADGNLVGQFGWLQTGTAVVANHIQVTSGQVVLQTSGQDVYKGLTSTVPTTAGTSLYTVAEVTLSAAQATGDYFLHLSDPLGTASNFYQRLFARSSGGGFQFGLVDTSGTGSTTTWGTTVLSFNTIYTVAIAWNFVSGTNNDTFEVFVDNASYLTHTWTSTSIAEPAQIAAANWRQGAAGSSASVKADSLTVTDVNPVPEPSTYAMLLGGAGAAAMMIFRRNRRRS